MIDLKKECGENKFTWGDAIVIAKNAPLKFKPGEFASVCGFYRITTEESSKEFQCKVGDWIYTIEFQDGSDLQVAEMHLKKFEAE